MSDKDLAYIKKRTKELREKRLCVSCGKNPLVTKNLCEKCNNRKKLWDKRRNERLKTEGLCTRCGKNPLVTKTDCQECAEKCNKKANARTLKNKDKCYAAYGGYKCNCPGCDITNPFFLSIDHVNNDGAKERKNKTHSTGNSLYRWLIKNNFPEGFQVLCHNCNIGKHRNGGICPHLTK